MIFESVTKSRPAAIYDPKGCNEATENDYGNLTPVVSGVSLPRFFGTNLFLKKKINWVKVSKIEQDWVKVSILVYITLWACRIEMAQQQHKPCENNIQPYWKKKDFQLLEYDVASPGFPMCQIDFYLRYGTKQHSYEPMLHWRPSKMASLWPISVFRTPYYSEKNNFIKN